MFVPGADPETRRSGGLRATVPAKTGIAHSRYFHAPVFRVLETAPFRACRIWTAYDNSAWSSTRNSSCQLCAGPNRTAAAAAARPAEPPAPRAAAPCRFSRAAPGDWEAAASAGFRQDRGVGEGGGGRQKRPRATRGPPPAPAPRGSTGTRFVCGTRRTSARPACRCSART